MKDRSILLNGGADMSFKISWKFHMLSIIITCTFCLLAQEYICTIFSNLVLENVLLEFSRDYIFNLCIFIVLITVPITIVHEVMHGVVYMLFGGKVKFGFKGIYAYIQETSGIPIYRTKFSIILLAPVILISIVSAVVSSEISWTIFLLNLIGSIGRIGPFILDNISH